MKAVVITATAGGPVPFLIVYNCFFCRGLNSKPSSSFSVYFAFYMPFHIMLSSGTLISVDLSLHLVYVDSPQPASRFNLMAVSWGMSFPNRQLSVFV